jgi:hypothetical protein
MTDILPIIRGKRVMLREFTEEDWTSVHAYASQEIACRYQPWGPNTEKDSQLYVKQIIEDTKKNPRTRFAFAVINMGTILIPILTGVIGAILPAEKAVKILPYQGIQGTFENTQKTEKRFKYVFSVAGAALFIGILSLLASAIPDIKHSNSSSDKREKIERTEGKVIETFTAEDETVKESTKQMGDNKGNHSNSIQSYIDSAYKTLKLGESHVVNNDADVLTFGHKVPTPTHMTKPNEGMEFITIPVTLELKSEDERFVFKPLSYRMMNNQGNEYQVKDMKIIENENWKDKVYIKSPGKAKVLLTFEVPAHEEKLIMLVKHEWLPGNIVVEVK